MMQTYTDQEIIEGEKSLKRAVMCSDFFGPELVGVEVTREDVVKYLDNVRAGKAFDLADYI